VNNENSDGNDTQGANTESLRRDLEDEKARYREQEQKMEELSTSTTMAEGASDRLKEETARAKKLEAEVQSLRVELANMSKPSKGIEAPQLEVLKLQTELEEVKEQREKDKLEAENRIAEIQRQKDSVDVQYQSLLGRVTTIRTTLGERMKADAVGVTPYVQVCYVAYIIQEELAQAKQTVEDLEEQNRSLNDTVEELGAELDKLRGDKDDASRELSSLRNRLNLAQQNWNKEREDLIKAERLTKEEYDVARQAMQDWEVIATEERAVRESLSDRVIELEEHLATQKELYERMATDYEKQGSSMEGLQRALQEIQDGMHYPRFHFQKPDIDKALVQPERKS
jgi:chromosome segregation ATPase